MDLRCLKMQINYIIWSRNQSNLFYLTVYEFAVALLGNDFDDDTLAIIESIDSDKITRTVWDLIKYHNGIGNAHQTDIAKKK